MAIRPTAGFLRRVHARRGHALAPPQKPPQLDKLWARAQAVWKGTAPNWTPGFGLNDDPLTKHAEQAAELLAGGRPRTFDRNVFAAAERMVGFNTSDDHSLVWVACDLAGPVAAAEVELLALQLEPARVQAGEKWGYRLEANPAHVRGSLSFDAVRSIVSAMSEVDYAAARARFEAALPSLGPGGRANAAYFFPSEPWADTELRALLASPTAERDAWQFTHLLASCTDGALARQMMGVLRWGALVYLPDLVLGLPPEELAPLVDCALLAAEGKTVGNVEWVTLAETLASVDTPRAAPALGLLLTHKFAGPAAVAYFRAHPAVAVEVLGPLAAGKTKLAEAARAVLEGAAQRGGDASAEAPKASLPMLLQDPPWRRKGKVAPRAVLALDAREAQPQERIAWEPGERENEAKDDHWRGAARPMTPDEVAAYDALPEPRPVDVWRRYQPGHSFQFDALLVPEDRGLPHWTENPAGHASRGPLYMLARYGEAAIDGLLKREPFVWNLEVFTAMTHVVSPRIALFAARGLQRKPYRKLAVAWLHRYPDTAALGLMPIALGVDGKDQRSAEDALRLITLGLPTGDRFVREAARHYGADAEREIGAFLSRDPLSLLELKGKTPDFLRLDDLPRPRTREGARVDREALSHLIDALRGSALEPAYPGLRLLREALDAGSLAELAWALTTQWTLAGAKIIHAWMPQALAHFGDDRAVRRFAPLAAEWARKDAKKADLAVQILAAIGSDAALLYLGNMADKARLSSAREAAQRALAAIADVRGLSPEVLADRTVPSLDLDADGSTTLDFGPRTFRVVFDETLAPVVITEDGTRAKVLPRKNARDDAAKAKEGAARWNALRSDAAAVAGHQVRRLERAMVNGRRWSSQDFLALAAHPLLGHLVRRLVWAEFVDGSASRTFRVAEDGTLADASDRAAVPLDADAAVELGGGVGLVHPIHLPDAARNAWGGVFGDYEILQPFEQLGRSMYHASDLGQGALSSARFEGVQARAGVVLGTLDARGWDRMMDSWVGSYARAVRPARAGGPSGRVTLTFEPGISMDDVAGSPVQSLRALSLEGFASWTDVDPVDVSEAIRDVEALR